jgi:hypothetical protein
MRTLPASGTFPTTWLTCRGTSRTDRGLEAKIRDKLAALRAEDKEAREEEARDKAARNKKHGTMKRATKKLGDKEARDND